MNASNKGMYAVFGAIGLATVLFAWNTIARIQSNNDPWTGDGESIESYGFDLSNLSVPRDLVVSTGMPKDGLDPLDYPEFMDAGEVDPLREEIRGKYLVSGDRVIGVSINGEARAYPVRIMEWHEAINDTVGGTPIAVTYCPLTDSAAVFKRVLGGETLEFGLSGLLYNSNHLLYDKRDNPAKESLWSQLRMEAVSGPAAGTKLEPIPCAVARWLEWKTRYPESKVVRPDVNLIRKYQGNPYGNYHSSSLLRFPAEPAVPEGGLPGKTPLLIAGIDGGRIVIPFTEAAANADENGVWKTEFGGHRIWFSYTRVPPTLQVNFGHFSAPPVDYVLYSYYFAWNAMHPGSEFAELPPNAPEAVP